MVQWKCDSWPYFSWSPVSSGLRFNGNRLLWSYPIQAKIIGDAYVSQYILVIELQSTQWQNCVRLSIFVALVFLARYWLCNSSGQSIHHVFWFTSARSVYCSIFIWLLLLLFQSTEFVHNHILSPFFRSFDTYWIEMMCSTLGSR